MNRLCIDDYIQRIILGVVTIAAIFLTDNRRLHILCRSLTAISILKGA